MKKIKFTIGGMLLFAGLFIISFNSYSQEKKLTRQEQKELRKSKLAANFHLINDLIERRNFVLEADFLQNKYGDRVHVTPMLNFIRVDSNTAVLQTGSSANAGYNGVGGVTAEGTIDRWMVQKNIKNLSYYIQFSVVTNIGVYDVSMTINANNFAQATISGLRRGKLMYDGHIEPVENSIVYKGQNTI